MINHIEGFLFSQPQSKINWMELVLRGLSSIENLASFNNNQQPTTNNQQPTTNNQQPTTNNQQPTTNNQQLTTND